MSRQIQDLVPRSLRGENSGRAVASSLISRQSVYPSPGTLNLLGLFVLDSPPPDRLVRGMLHNKERKPLRFGVRKDEVVPEMVAAIVLAGLGLATAVVNLAVAVIELVKQRNRTPRRCSGKHRRGHTF